MPPDRDSLLGFSLSRQLGALLLRMLEREQPVISHELLSEQAEPAPLVSAGALTPERFATSVMLMEEDGPRAVDLEWIADRNAYGYFTADGYMVPDQTTLKYYQLNVNWWLSWLSNELELVDVGTPFELVKGHAWDLGDRWTSRRSKVPVIFVRRLRHQKIAKETIGAMMSRSGREGGLLLTSSKQLPELAIWPNRFQARCITSLLAADAEQFRFDSDLICGPFSSPASDSGDLVSLSPDLHTLTIDGHVLGFRGTIQQQIVRLLVDAYLAKRRLRVSDVLQRAQSGAPDFAKAFKNNHSWPILRRYLKRENGFCWIELPE
jgi:hypothetical protein